MSDSWKTAHLDPAALAALREGPGALVLWSLLMHVTNVRARRNPSRILDQWKRDGFTAPAAIDQLTSNRKLAFVASGQGTQLVAQAFRSATPR